MELKMIKFNLKNQKTQILNVSDKNIFKLTIYIM